MCLIQLSPFKSGREQSARALSGRTRHRTDVLKEDETFRRDLMPHVERIRSVLVHTFLLVIASLAFEIPDKLSHQLSGNVKGKIVFRQMEGNSTYFRDSGKLASYIPTVVSFELFDPRHNLHSVPFIYTWDLGNGEVRKGPESFVECNYTFPGNYTFQLSIETNTPQHSRMTGLYSVDLTVLDAIKSVELQGPSIYNVDQSSSLSFHVGGSPPVWLCWRVLSECQSPSPTSCNLVRLYGNTFNLNYTFRSVGTYCFDLNPAGAVTGVLVTTFPIIPCLGLHFRFRVPPVHFLFVGHFSALRRLVPREVLLVMLTILSVSLSDCLPVANRTVYRVCETLLPAFCRPSLFHWTIPFERRQPRPIAWTLTTPFVLPSPHLSAVVDLSLPITKLRRQRIQRQRARSRQRYPLKHLCSHVNQQPNLYSTDESKIAFICSLLTGRALEWATAVWDLGRPAFPSFATFLQSFKAVFQPNPESSEAGEQIMALKQGRRTAADYALDFRTLAAQSGWNDGPLKLHYRKGLNPDLQVELACRDEGLSLNQYIDLSIRIDNVMRARKPVRTFTPLLPSQPSTMTAPEPMQLGATKLTVEERERRIKNHLCLYCGQPGHLRATCPTRPPRPPTSVSSDPVLLNHCVVPAILKTKDISIRTTALIDSGAAGNFIDRDFVATNCLPVLSCTSPVAVAALDGRPLGTGRVEHTTDDLTLCLEPQHQETIRFFIISSPRTPLILGYPWLNQHEPVISWSSGTITQWSSHCTQHHPQPDPPAAPTPASTKLQESIPAEYHDLLEAFSTTKATQLPPHRPGDCAIDLLPGSIPPRGRIFPLSQPEAEAMNQYIKEELTKGFIRPSTSPASAGFFFVKKKDGGLRPCIDYRALNDITVKYRYPLPLVPPALEQLRAAKIYTKLDLRSAYNLIRIRAGDEWKTAFSTTTGHYEYRVMPFGLANSPSYFQAFVNDVFRDMLNRWVIIYIDDILIYSNSYSEHVQHVRAVLQRLVKHELYAKEEKCEFHQERITFLGYVISPEGVAMDESKVNAVRNWPRPKTLKELQRFLGFSNFYRRFIRNFSTVAAPLSSMIKQGSTRLTWTPAAAQAYDELRQRFTTAPILHHPDPNLPFLVEVDASNTGVGAVLSQRQGQPLKTYPCAFFSHKLSPAERNYDVGNRELLAIKLALEEWRHWLEGARHPFTILTDRSQEPGIYPYCQGSEPPSSQMGSVLYQVSLRHNVSTRLTEHESRRLSRIHEPDHSPATPETIIPTSVILAPVAWDIMTEITESHTQDPPPDDCPANLTYVPVPLRSRVLSEVHSNPSSGHPGIEATIDLLRNRFWWQTLRPDTITFIKNCSVCNTSKVPRQLPAGLSTTSPAVDFITDLPASNGQTTILSVVDRFSKGCRFIPFPKLPSAMETAEALCNSVFRFYGLPEDIVSDRGPQFTSRLWTSFFRLLGVNVSLTSGYHPQANGQVERLNQELTRFLRSYCQDHQEDWCRFLLWAEYAQNSIRKPSTNLTPFQCTLGFQPPLFPWSGEPSDLPAVNSWFQRSEETWNRAHVHLQRAVRRTQTQADRRRRVGPTYEPGQWVWLSTRDLRLRLPCKKLSPRYVGPFRILRQITPVSFRLELPPEYRISPTFHMSLLKPAGRPGGGGEPRGDRPAETCPPDHRRRGGLSSQYHSGLPAPEGSSAIFGRLGGLRPRGEVMGARRGHPRSCSRHRLPRIAPRSTSTPRKGQTPAPVTSSCQEALAGGGLCHKDGLCGPLHSQPAGAVTGVLVTTFPIIPCLGLHFRFRVPPVHFLFVGHFSALRRLVPREVLLVMLTILSVSLSDCLPVANRTVYRVCETLLPAFCRPSLFHWTIPFERRQPRPIAWTLTTPFVLPSPHLSAVVDLSLPITFVSKIKLLQMDPTPPDSSLTKPHSRTVSLIFILPCAAVIVSTLIFISVSVCRPRQQSLMSKALMADMNYLSFTEIELHAKDASLTLQDNSPASKTN
ncbi:Transposon Tf2-9 polyprotein [Labeo rohita]|uniref:Gypsy retrotransposon integrase-like protein 1 n=1 Tax=Labeo rohita TaxID=84645 RepID=A0ABQ8M6N6_LABRO|nr:Transposon Tf2-9 polyprotein [Labeo rohita]